jgi:hypothetical protein
VSPRRDAWSANDCAGVALEQRDDAEALTPIERGNGAQLSQANNPPLRRLRDATIEPAARAPARLAHTTSLRLLRSSAFLRGLASPGVPKPSRESRIRVVQPEHGGSVNVPPKMETARAGKLGPLDSLNSLNSLDSLQRRGSRPECYAQPPRPATLRTPGESKGLKLAVHASAFVDTFSARIGENIVNENAGAVGARAPAGSHAARAHHHAPTPAARATLDRRGGAARPAQDESEPPADDLTAAFRARVLRGASLSRATRKADRARHRQDDQPGARARAGGRQSAGVLSRGLRPQLSDFGISKTQSSRWQASVSVKAATENHSRSLRP